MNEIQLIHVVESSKKYAWFEKLFTHLATQGFTQALVTLEPKGEINESLGFGKIVVKLPKSKKAIISSIQALTSVRKLRKEGQTNFLILHGHRAALVGSLGARVANLDYGIVHHVQPKYFQLLRTQYPLRSFTHQFIYRYYVRRAKIVQSLSKEVTLSLTALGCDPEKIVAVGHGVDFDAFQESLENPPGNIFKKPGFPRILMVGRLVWEKNYTLAVEVFAELCKSYPDAQLLIAGSGPAENEIKSLIKRFNLSENVSLLGRVENVPELMVHSDLLMHFALTESYGQVYIEACLTSLPIFTFPTGIAIDLSEESDPLIHLLTQSDPEWISDQIRQFLVSSPKRQSSNISLMRNHYRKHNQEEVFQEMSKYLKRLIPELNQDNKK
jgi:glycosyltransferase involved in cell wall biosynthesis